MARRHSAGRKVVITGAAWAVGFVIFFPILWMVMTSFKTELDAFASPPKFLFFDWTLENYGVVQQRSDYLKFASNSVILALGSTFIAMLIAVPALAGNKDITG